MPLCKVCQSIDTRDLLTSFRKSEVFSVLRGFHDNGPYLFSTNSYQRHQDSFLTLRNAAGAGCEFCGMVWAHHTQALNSSDAHNEDKCKCKNYLGPVRLIIYQTAYDRTPLLNVVIMPKNPRRESPDGYVAAELELCTANGVKIPRIDIDLQTRLAQDERPSDLRSKLCLSMAASWLNKCLHEHPKCIAKENKQTVPPTRVIDVGTASKRPFLHISKDNEPLKWVALSYCWGGDSVFTLNTTSFSNLRNGLPLSDFPPTIRDAVLVTRALGIQYLWVDSLCIFQDDTNDWAKEASRMSDVYRYAIVTIAATSADSVRTGFLDKRERYFNCALPWRRRGLFDGLWHRPQTYPIFVRRNSNFDDHQRRADTSRWATRGWTFQEEFLSSRLLFYTTGRMLWQCYSGNAVEPKADVEKRYNRSTFPRLKDIFLGSNDLANITGGSSGFTSSTAIYDSWYQLLSQYSLRRLTFDRDCLPAIAGFAKPFQDFLKDQYFAGLWRRDILYGLLWSVRPGGTYTTDKPFDQAVTRILSNDTGPSWSWVGAFSMGVEWPLGRGPESWPHRGDNFMYPARVVDVEVYGTTHDDLGCIKGGRLILDAPYRNVDLRLGDEVVPPWNLQTLAQIVLTRPGLIGASRSAAISRSDTVQRLTFVRIAEGNAYGRRHSLWLLLLEPHSTSDSELTGQKVYRRVTVVHLTPDDSEYDDPEAVKLSACILGDVYSEVVKGNWPSGRFIII